MGWGGSFLLLILSYVLNLIGATNNLACLNKTKLPTSFESPRHDLSRWIVVKIIIQYFANKLSTFVFSSSMQSGSSKTPDSSWTASTLSESSSSARSSAPIPQKRNRKSTKQNYSVVRPTEAPPKPPPANPKG